MTDFVRSQIEKAGMTGFASAEAEKSVLFCLLADMRDCGIYMGELRETDFYFEQNAKLFGVIKATAAKGSVDLVTVDAQINAMYPLLYQQLVEHMMTCFNAFVNVRNCDDYVSIVKGLSRRRATIKSVTTILEQLKDPTQDYDAALDKLHAEGADIANGRHSFESVSDLMCATFEYLERRASGKEQCITTGLANLDKLIGGLYKGELTIVAARPSVGKSAFGLNVALAAARQGFNVVFCSREMRDIQYGQRRVSHQAGIDGMKLRTAKFDADDWEKIAVATAEVSELPIQFLFTVRTIEDLRRAVQLKHSKGEVDLLIVDYLGIMDTAKTFRDGSKYLQVGYISRMLKEIAMDCDIPVVALSQVNRDTEGQMPTLKAIRDSGSIEQDADGVIFLHAPASANDPAVDPYDRDSFETFAQAGYTYLTIGVAKQRQGMTGNAPVLFDKAHMTYTLIDRVHEG